MFTIKIVVGAAIFVILCYYLYKCITSEKLVCVVSDVDGDKYCVRQRKYKQTKEAANLLATVANKCEQFVKYLKEKHPNNEKVKLLCDRFDKNVISETLPDSIHTAYSENKGEKIAFCLNVHSKEGTEKKLIDENTLMFVSLHELAHLMTASTGHNQDFWNNFKFLLKNAVQGNYYSPQNYSESPQQYCGMSINDNPMYSSTHQ